MKWIAGIFASVVLFLTVQPVFAYVDETQEAGCGKHCCAAEPAPPAAEEQPDDACSDFCNPFLQCGACSATTIEFLTYSLAQPGQTSTRYMGAEQRIHSSFAADFWQPPRQA